jgi:hypothetical protein
MVVETSRHHVPLLLSISQTPPLSTSFRAASAASREPLIEIQPIKKHYKSILITSNTISSETIHVGSIKQMARKFMICGGTPAKVSTFSKRN